jgi:hypothetical protein
MDNGVFPLVLPIIAFLARNFCCDLFCNFSIDLKPYNILRLFLTKNILTCFFHSLETKGPKKAQKRNVSYKSVLDLNLMFSIFSFKVKITAPYYTRESVCIR